MNPMNKHHLLLIVGFLVLTAPAGTAQVRTVKPGEPVERHLSADQTPKEWSRHSDGADHTKSIKICRALIGGLVLAGTITGFLHFAAPWMPAALAAGYGALIASAIIIGSNYAGSGRLAPPASRVLGSSRLAPPASRVLGSQSEPRQFPPGLHAWPAW